MEPFLKAFMECHAALAGGQPRRGESGTRTTRLLIIENPARRRDLQLM